jgi:hypothetical protein
MWRGHEHSLAEYAEIMCIVWQQRGFKDTLRDQFRAVCDELLSDSRWHHSPNWLGYDRLHSSHRSNLLRKDANHYGQFGWQEPADIPYWWPTQQEAVA